MSRDRTAPSGRPRIMVVKIGSSTLVRGTDGPDALILSISVPP